QPTNQPTNNLTLQDAYRIMSAREGEVFRLMGAGKSNRQIASKLFISVDTVENHITRIGTKLGLSGRGQARQWVKWQYDRL
ncbi:MAG: LuxR family transcriptional regulator, partial [Balneolaceae bacterium]